MDPQAESHLRELLASRERELELRRVGTSRRFTRILLLGAAAIGIAIWIQPDRNPAPRAPAAVAHAPVVAAPTPAAGVDPDFKHFVTQPSGDSHAADLDFAIELLQFVQPRAAPVAK